MGISGGLAAKSELVFPVRDGACCSSGEACAAGLSRGGGERAVKVRQRGTVIEGEGSLWCAGGMEVRVRRWACSRPQDTGAEDWQTDVSVQEGCKGIPRPSRLGFARYEETGHIRTGHPCGLGVPARAASLNGSPGPGPSTCNLPGLLAHPSLTGQPPGSRLKAAVLPEGIHP